MRNDIIGMLKLLSKRIMQNKRTVHAASSNIPLVKVVSEFHPDKNRQSFLKRLQIFQSLKQHHDQVLSALPKEKIVITLKDGKSIEGLAFQTTAGSIAKSISKNLFEKSVAAKINYTRKIVSPLSSNCVAAQVQNQDSENAQEILDLNRPLEGDCTLQLIMFDSPEGKQVFWHSSAHILGQALQKLYGGFLTHGPPLQNGFFYDCFMGPSSVNQTKYQSIEKCIEGIVKENQQFERIVINKKQALQLFQSNPFKQQLIQHKVPDDALTSAYRCGNLIDLCMGPHLPSTGMVKGFKVVKNSSSNWLGKTNLDSLQRVYGISFPSSKQLNQYVKVQQKLAQKDHRTIGPKQSLFNFNPLAPGNAFFLPHGTIMYNKILNFLRKEYIIRGYKEVISPNLYNSQLWKISGHYFKYKENMFCVHNEDGQYGLKPMNCPGHCLMFDMTQKSYRDLPVRYADFGVLHRNQIHGALTGLTRVRRFQQDDAHIFCRSDQIEQQIIGVLDFLEYVYEVMGFKYAIQLSTRPKEFLGEIEVWNEAQEQLKRALNKFGKPFKINPEDGAFYGPKIDIKLFDVYQREHQCGTIQLDFQLPKRFNLQYRVKQSQSQTLTEEQKKKAKQAEKLRREQEKKEKKLKKKQEKGKKQEAKQSQQENQSNEQQLPPSQQIHSQPTAGKSQQELYAIQKPLKKDFTRPVIIHRAIVGSVQRFLAIMIESFGGKWPFWLSPRQIVLIPISGQQLEYAQNIVEILKLKGYSAQIDSSNNTLSKMILNAQNDQFNYIGVVGKQEMKQNKIDLRDRDKSERIGKFSLEQLVGLFQSLQPKISKREKDLRMREQLLRKKSD